MIVNRIEKLTELFLPQGLEPGTPRATSANILVRATLANIVLTMLAVCIVQFSPQFLADSNRLFALMILFPIAALLVLSLLLFRRYGSLLLSGNLISLSSYIPITVGTLVTGGYDDSPVLPVYIIVPIFAFLTAGLRSGVAWGLLVVLAQILLQLDCVQTWQVMQFLSPDEIVAFHAVLPVFTGVTVFVALAIFEINNQSLRQQLHYERDKYAHKSRHDVLTGLPNRNEFSYRLRKGIENAQAQSEKLAVLYLDLDGFKPINDQYGHHAGDVVLVAVANRIKKELRASDTVARLGGDEFAVVLQGITDISQLQPLAEKIREVVAEPVILDGQPLPVKGSIGIAIYPDDALDADLICRNADIAMYAAKQQHNTYCFYHTLSHRR